MITKKDILFAKEISDRLALPRLLEILILRIAGIIPNREAQIAEYKLGKQTMTEALRFLGYQT